MLKDTWTNKVDGVDINSADDINQVAQAVIDLENKEIKITVDSKLDLNSENPVQNKVVTERFNEVDAKEKSLQYYGDINIVPSDNSLFRFTVDDTTMTATAELLIGSGNNTFIVPYEYIKNDKRYRVSSVLVTGGHVERLTLSNSVQSVYFFDTTVDNVVISNSVTTIEIREDVATSQFVTIGYIYFRGTKSQWDAITIAENNDVLLNATIYYEWSDVTKSYVDEKIGNIDTALDNIIKQQESIIAIQNTLIGGGSK